MNRGYVQKNYRRHRRAVPLYLSEMPDGQADDNQDSPQLDGGNRILLRDPQECTDDDRKDDGSEIRPRCPQARRIQGRQDKVGLAPSGYEV